MDKLHVPVKLEGLSISDENQTIYLPLDITFIIQPDVSRHGSTLIDIIFEPDDIAPNLKQILTDHYHKDPEVKRKLNDMAWELIKDLDENPF